MTASSPIASRPIGIMPGGCFPPTPTEPTPPPLGRNCWVPRDRDGNPILLPSPDASIQATDAAALLR